ncbi:MAG: hypothetical protein WCQ76_06250 [Fusobacterium sp.]
MIRLNKEIFKYFNLLGTVGLIIILNIIFSIVLYKIFVKYFGESLIIFLLLIAFGIINGFYNVYKIIFKK